MGRYIIRRVLWVIVVMIVVTFLAFLVFYVLPSSKPENSFVGKAPTPELIAQVRKDLALNRNDTGEAMSAFFDVTQQNMTGTVRLKLYKGNVIVTGRVQCANAGGCEALW